MQGLRPPQTCCVGSCINQSPTKQGTRAQEDLPSTEAEEDTGGTLALPCPSDYSKGLLLDYTCSLL